MSRFKNHFDFLNIKPLPSPILRLVSRTYSKREAIQYRIGYLRDGELHSYTGVHVLGARYGFLLDGIQKQQNALQGFIPYMKLRIALRSVKLVPEQDLKEYKNLRNGSFKRELIAESKALIQYADTGCKQLKCEKSLEFPAFPAYSEVK